MCGLAGYNCSPDWQATFITTPDIQKGLLTEAWLHNLHRGNDAAGYFMLKNDETIKAYRQGSDAETLLRRNLRKTTLPTTRVFGAHTRAMTKGSPSINTNNHPVYFNGVWVTHNGTISNHETIKEWVKDVKHLPEVDSVAIPITLSSVKNPLNTEQVAQALSHLDGGYAFHAVWRDAPGVSVLARGGNSPLVVGIHPSGCVVYASEVPAVWALISAMNADIQDRSWQFISLQEYSVLFVQDGRIVDWIKMAPPLSWHHTKMNTYLYRMLPDPCEVVYQTDLSNDFMVKFGEAGRDITSVADDKRELVYTREDGFRDDKEKFPRASDINAFSSLSEADTILKNKESGALHAFFGSVEIIINNRNVVDVYNHELFETSQRWFEEEKTATEAVQVDTLEEFLERHGTEIKQLPNLSTYKYRQAQTFSGTNVHQMSEYRAQNAGLQLVRPGITITWNNLWEVAVPHKSLLVARQGFMFPKEHVRCKNHGGIEFVKHSNPQDCAAAKGAAVHVLAAVESLDITEAIVLDAKLVTIAPKRKTDTCTNGNHTFIDTEFVQIMLANEKVIEILSAEKCYRCDTRREIQDWPMWLLSLFTGKRVL